MIAERVYQARRAAGLTLAALGEKAGVSHTTVRKYEKGALVPSSAMLLKIARACGVRTEYFFRTHTVELLHAEFRKQTSFGKAAQEALKIRVTELAEKRVELLNAFPEPPLPQFAPPAGLPARIASLDALEAFSDEVRSAWQLGFNPVADLTDTLEGLGLLVVVVDADHPGFSGMTAMVRDGEGRLHPVIAVSGRWPGDRQRFTLAHELGHLLLAGRLAEDIHEERACDRFAGAFLAPRQAVLQSLGAQRHGLEWQELYARKHEFGLSMAGWLQRARQCGVLSETAHLSMLKRFSAKGWRKNEPGEPLPQERPRMFAQLVYRALSEQYLSEAKAAQLLGMPMMRFHKARQMETLDEFVHQ